MCEKGSHRSLTSASSLSYVPGLESLALLRELCDYSNIRTACQNSGARGYRCKGSPMESLLPLVTR